MVCTVLFFSFFSFLPVRHHEWLIVIGLPSLILSTAFYIFVRNKIAKPFIFSFIVTCIILSGVLFCNTYFDNSKETRQKVLFTNLETKINIFHMLPLGGGHRPGAKNEAYNNYIYYPVSSSCHLICIEGDHLQKIKIKDKHRFEALDMHKSHIFYGYRLGFFKIPYFTFKKIYYIYAE